MTSRRAYELLQAYVCQIPVNPVTLSYSVQSVKYVANSLFYEIAYDITPLLRGDIFFIVNPTDNSWIAAPSLTYSVATNWEIYLLAFPSEGKTGSEFGGFPAQYFMRMQYSF